MAFGAVTLLAVAAGSARAQGGLSVLGFGYPVGGTSTRAAATGGSFGEFDALSPMNPASLGAVERTVITVQTEPEFRTLRLGGTKEYSSAQRVPLLNLVFPVGHGVAVGVSGTTFLDRSYTTITTDNLVIDGASAVSTDRTDVRGSIGDMRAAVGWHVNSRFSVGLGGHLFTGNNLVAVSRTFADTLKFGNVNDTSSVVYFGTGLSVGGEWRVSKGFAATLSYRRGGGIESRVRDTIRTKANIPDRVGFGVRYDGIPGSVFAFSINQQDWSRMRALGSTAVQPRSATDWNVGAEVSGPRMRGAASMVRAGFAHNALPFGLSGSVVNETRFTAGLGLPLSREAAVLDLSVQRANRTLVTGSAKESAWMLGIGMQIRP
jgi:hypothetical protein